MYVCLYRAHGVDRVAFVATQPSSSGAGTMVQVSRGPKRQSVSAKMYGPLDEVEAAKVFEREVDALVAEGFVRSGLAAMLSALDSKKKRKRALAALRLGWLKQAAAVEPLLELSKKANEELPSLIEALGELGDKRAIPAARAASERKLLSRRRAGVEALWKLGDKEGLADAKNRALERLTPAVRLKLEALDLGSEQATDVEALAAVVREEPVKDRGLALDTLYELRTPLTVQVTRRLIASEPIDKPHLFRYAKSVLKRAKSRYDFVTFGALVHRLHRLGKSSTGVTTTVKSGYDGESKSMRIFGRKTQAYLTRSVHRYLQRLAKHRPLWYAPAAAEILIHYKGNDEQEPSGLSGRYASCYLLSRIVFGTSQRFKIDYRKLRVTFRSHKHAKTPEGVREEAFPEQWDAAPAAYLRLLGAASLPIVHEIALRAVRAKLAIITEAPSPAIVAMIGAPYPPTVEIALAELRQRFDPAAPDLEILQSLLADARPNVRSLGIEWLEASRAAWTRDAALVIALLRAKDAAVRSAVAEQAALGLEGAASEVRRAIAASLYELLRAPEAAEGDHDAYARLGQVLGAEIAAIATADDLMALLATGSASARAVAVSALSEIPDAAARLGLERLARMAVDPNGAVRTAAHRLLGTLAAELAGDPSPLFTLLESEWADARRFAKDMLSSKVELGVLSLEALLGLCDSNLVEAQDLGKELVEKRLASLPADKLIAALTQHPHKNIRRFAVKLVVEQLQAGFVRLAAIEEFFRMVLLDVEPDRTMKRTIVDFLGKRGLEDEHQAAVAARLLTEVAKSRTRFESDKALVRLAAIKISFPEVDSPAFELTGAAAAPPSTEVPA